MSKGGHTLAALALGCYIALAVPHGALLGLLTAFARSLPDTIVGVADLGPAGERRWLLVLGLLLPAARLPSAWGARRLSPPGKEYRKSFIPTCTYERRHRGYLDKDL